MTRHTALVDLDGTLTDPADGILGGFGFALRRLDAPVPARADLEWVIGPPLRQSLPKLVPDPTPERVEAAVAAYREYYAGVGILEASVYPGIPEALQRLRGTGLRLLLCTVKPRVFAGPVINHFGLAGYFDAVYGAELDGRFEDKGELMAHIVAEHALTPQALVMIGDRGIDMSAARRNGIAGVGVMWGYGTAEELAAGGAARLCSAPDALPGAVQALLRT